MCSKYILGPLYGFVGTKRQCTVRIVDVCRVALDMLVHMPRAKRPLPMTYLS